MWSRLQDRWGDHIRGYMDKWGTLPKRVTSPTWGPPPPCKHALSDRVPEGFHSHNLQMSHFEFQEFSFSKGGQVQYLSCENELYLDENKKIFLCQWLCT